MNKLLKVLMPYMYHESKILFLHSLANKAHKKGFLLVSVLIEGFILRRYGCAISPLAIIGKRVRLGHPIGIVIGAGVVIGDDVVIYQNTTIGRKSMNNPGGARVGRGTIIYSNSVIVGDVVIGDNCVVGAGSFVDFDLPDNAVFGRGRLSVNKAELILG